MSFGEPELRYECERSPACDTEFAALEQRIQGCERDLKSLDERVRVQGESIAALKAQVAMWAALGAILGGGLVTLMGNLLTRSPA